MFIVDISKTFVCNFHYEKIVSRYGNKAKLLMTDKDSLGYQLETADVYTDVISDLDAYGIIDYSKTYPTYS